MTKNFNGHWILNETEYSHEVNPWLHDFTINGLDVLDGCGYMVTLEQIKGRVYFEGGRLGIIKDVLYREGKTGVILTFKKGLVKL